MGSDGNVEEVFEVEWEGGDEDLMVLLCSDILVVSYRQVLLEVLVDYRCLEFWYVFGFLLSCSVVYGSVESRCVDLFLVWWNGDQYEDFIDGICICIFFCGCFGYWYVFFWYFELFFVYQV